MTTEKYLVNLTKSASPKIHEKAGVNTASVVNFFGTAFPIPCFDLTIMSIESIP